MLRALGRAGIVVAMGDDREAREQPGTGDRREERRSGGGRVGKPPEGKPSAPSETREERRG